MTGTALQSVRVPALHDLPVQTRNTSQKLIRIISATAKSGRIQPILVGRVGSQLYPVNDSEAVSGLRRARVGMVDAVVVEYDTMRDLLEDHVRRNFQPQTVDPLRLRDVVKYMARDGTEVSDICRRLSIDRRPELRNTIHLEIAEKAKAVLFEMLDDISKKMYSVVTPPYYLTKLAKIRRDEQYKAALEIKSVTMARMVSDSNSSWPAPESIEVVLRGMHKGKKTPPARDRVGKCEKDKKDLRRKKKAASTATDSENEKAEKYVAEDPNLIYVPLDGTHPDLLFNKKTGRVAIAKETDTVYALTDDLGVTTYSISGRVTKYLRFADAYRIDIKTYPTDKKAGEVLVKSARQERCGVIRVTRVGA